MRYILSILLFCCYANLTAQNTVQLNTPYYWLKDAYHKAGKNDTSGVFSSMKNAVGAGLFDVQALTSNKTIVNLLSTQQKESIAKEILSNRRRIESPSAIKVVTEDVDRFWELYPYINDSLAEKIFLDDYISKGSVGLQTFYQIRMNSSLHSFVEKIRAKQSFYNSIKAISTQFTAQRPAFITAAKKLEALYPEAIFPPIYFLIGNLNNVGTADGYAGLLIGSEHLCNHTTLDTFQLTSIDKMVIFDTALAVPLIVHEYVHFQQKNTIEQTLLDYTIMEGVADFITYLVTGKYTNPEVYQYGFTHEAKIWKHFSSEMSGNNTDNWLFNTYSADTGYPGNLGYFIGFRICESYFKKSKDRQKAIKELLEIKDFSQFLSRSDYKGL